jgi:hypothetical protein
MFNNIALLRHTQHQALVHVVNSYVKHNSKTFKIFLKIKIYWKKSNYYWNGKANIIIVTSFLRFRLKVSFCSKFIPRPIGFGRWRYLGSIPFQCLSKVVTNGGHGKQCKTQGNCIV